MSILVTRPSPAGEELVSRLRTLGQVARVFRSSSFHRRELATVASRLSALTENDLVFALAARRHLCRCRASPAREKLAIPSALFCHWPYNGAGAAYC